MSAALFLSRLYAFGITYCPMTLFLPYSFVLFTCFPVIEFTGLHVSDFCSLTLLYNKSHPNKIPYVLHTHDHITDNPSPYAGKKNSSGGGFSAGLSA